MTERSGLKLLVVDGDPTLRQRLVHELGQRVGLTVVATAMGCRTGLPKIHAHRPDVVVVDLVTEGVEGMELLEKMRAEGHAARAIALVSEPAPARAKELAAHVLSRPDGLDDAAFSTWLDGFCARCSDSAAGEPARVIQAAEVGAPAREAVFGRAEPASPPARPAASVASVAREPMAPRPRPAAAVAAQSPAAVAHSPASRPAAAASSHAVSGGVAPRRAERHAHKPVEIVGIGISTGGPKALGVMLPMLPADLPVPVLIVQHMPPVFTASLAESLSRTCALPVREARAGEPVRPGQILIAPGGKHMRVLRVDGAVVIRITEDPPENSCRPAVDYLFRSLGEIYGAGTLAVMMTGMGEDGFAACRQLHGLGARIMAQDEASCTVFGMPRGPIVSGITDVVAPLDQLAARIVEQVRGGGR